MECKFHLLFVDCIEAWSWWFHRLTLELVSAHHWFSFVLLLNWAAGFFWSPPKVWAYSFGLFLCSIFPIRIEKGWRITPPKFVSTCFNVSFSLALLAPLCRSGPFSGSLSTVEDDYSRATLGKQSGIDSRQLAPDRKTDSKCWLIASFTLPCK